VKGTTHSRKILPHYKQQVIFSEHKHVLSGTNINDPYNNIEYPGHLTPEFDFFRWMHTINYMNAEKSGRKKTRAERRAARKPIETVSGVYFGENRFLRVVDQPSGRPGYVSSISNTATNFRLAARYGNIGLIAHNYLGGRIFHDLKIGDLIFVMDGHGRKRNYRVHEMLRYQAVDPRSTRSNFINLKNNQLCTTTDLFKRVYAGKHHLVLQTCIKKGRNEEWGRMFILAKPEKWK